jgi:hypothetical protein
MIRLPSLSTVLPNLVARKISFLCPVRWNHIRRRSSLFWRMSAVSYAWNTWSRGGPPRQKVRPVSIRRSKIWEVLRKISSPLCEILKVLRMHEISERPCHQNPKQWTIFDEVKAECLRLLLFFSSWCTQASQSQSQISKCPFAYDESTQIQNILVNVPIS